MQTIPIILIIQNSCLDQNYDSLLYQSLFKYTINNLLHIFRPVRT